MSEEIDYPTTEGSFTITRPDGATFMGYAYWRYNTLPPVLFVDRRAIQKWWNDDKP